MRMLVARSIGGGRVTRLLGRFIILLSCVAVACSDSERGAKVLAAAPVEGIASGSGSAIRSAGALAADAGAADAGSTDVCAPLALAVRDAITSKPSAAELNYPVLWFTRAASQLLIDKNLPFTLPPVKDLDIRFVLSRATICGGCGNQVRALALLVPSEALESGVDGGSVPSVPALPVEECSKRLDDVVSSLSALAIPGALVADLRGVTNDTSIQFHAAALKAVGRDSTSKAMENVVSAVLREQQYPAVDVSSLYLPIDLGGTLVGITLKGFPFVRDDMIGVLVARDADSSVTSTSADALVPLQWSDSGKRNTVATLPVVFVQGLFQELRSQAGRVNVRSAADGKPFVHVDSVTLTTALEPLPTLKADVGFALMNRDGTWNAIGTNGSVRATTTTLGLKYDDAPSAVQITGVAMGDCSQAPIPAACAAIQREIRKFVRQAEDSIRKRLDKDLRGRMLAGHIRPLSLPVSAGGKAHPAYFKVAELHLDTQTATVFVAIAAVE